MKERQEQLIRDIGYELSKYSDYSKLTLDINSFEYGLVKVWLTKARYPGLTIHISNISEDYKITNN